MRRGLLTVLVCLAAAGAVPALAALDDDGQRAVEEARESDDFRVFWLGERFRSQELTYAEHGQRRGHAFFSFGYGDCDPGPDSGCALPYAVQVYPGCTRNLASYDGLEPRRRKPIRGAAVYEFAEGGFFDRLEVYTGRTTVVVWAPTFAKARRVARYLEGINVELGRDDPLGRPARGALRGELRC